MKDSLLSDKLTILLTIKSRHEFTFRWLQYAKKKGFPFKILIADGSSDDVIQNHVDSGNFKSLNIKYVKFGEDVDYPTYYLKVKKSLSLVDTPYYIVADNDDFYSLVGLKEAVNFLDRNADYVACGGISVPFSIVGGDVYGARVKFYGSNYDTYWEAQPTQRLIKYFCGAPGPYYSVMKTEIAREAWTKICDRNFKDIRMPELLIDTLILTSGKVFNLNSPFYFRQIGSEIGNQAGLTHDFFDEVFAPTWSSEINYIADLVVRNCDDKNFSHQEFWFYLKQFLLPRVLTGIQIDSHNKNAQKVRKIFLVKSLRSGAIGPLLEELLRSWKGNYFKNKNADLEMIEDFLSSCSDSKKPLVKIV